MSSSSETPELLDDDDDEQEAPQRGAARPAGAAETRGTAFWTRLFPKARPKKSVRPVILRNIDPKTILANERTYISWLDMASQLGAIASGLLGFAGVSLASAMAASSAVGPHGPTAVSSALSMLPVIATALVMLPLSIGFAIYAMFQYKHRAWLMRTGQDGPFDELKGPMTLVAIWCAALVAMCIVAAVQLGTRTKLGKKV